MLGGDYYGSLIEIYETDLKFLKLILFYSSFYYDIFNYPRLD